MTKCKNGHEFEFPSYIIRRVRTGVPTVGDTGPDLNRYEIMTPVCPICQFPLSVAPPSKKKDVRRKKRDQKPKLQFPKVKKEPEKPKEDDA